MIKWKNPFPIGNFIIDSVQFATKYHIILFVNTVCTPSGKVGEAQLFYRIFSDMGRRGELYNYYYRTHKTNCSKMFTELRTTGSVDSWLHHFYSTLLELYHAQVNFIYRLTQ